MCLILKGVSLFGFFYEATLRNSFRYLLDRLYRFYLKPASALQRAATLPSGKCVSLLELPQRMNFVAAQRNERMPGTESKRPKIRLRSDFYSICFGCCFGNKGQSVADITAGSYKDCHHALNKIWTWQHHNVHSSSIHPASTGLLTRHMAKVFCFLSLCFLLPVAANHGKVYQKFVTRITIGRDLLSSFAVCRCNFGTTWARARTSSSVSCACGLVGSGW